MKHKFPHVHSHLVGRRDIEERKPDSQWLALPVQSVPAANIWRAIQSFPSHPPIPTPFIGSMSQCIGSCVAEAAVQVQHGLTAPSATIRLPGSPPNFVGPAVSSQPRCHRQSSPCHDQSRPQQFRPNHGVIISPDQSQSQPHSG